jgi:uncharacterized membrane protein (Fun14 family)
LPSIRISLGVVFILVLGLLFLRQQGTIVIEAYNTKNLVQLQAVTAGAPGEEEKTRGLNPELSWLGQINLTLLPGPPIETRGLFFFSPSFI